MIFSEFLKREAFPGKRHAISRLSHETVKFVDGTSEMKKTSINMHRPFIFSRFESGVNGRALKIVHIMKNLYVQLSFYIFAFKMKTAMLRDSWDR